MTAQATEHQRTQDVRVLVVDDHPALRAGLEGLLAVEPDLQCVGTIDGITGLEEMVRREHPHVVLLDYALGSDDGLTTCFRIKQRADPPAVVLYSAYVDDVFAVPAAMAQADAIVSKSAPAGELLSIVRRVSRGWSQRPQMEPDVMEAASARLLTEDLPIAAMLMNATPVPEIAGVLDMPVADVRSRALRIIGRLQARNRLISRTAASELP
jgi:DNA-binding NarL/FixJ family response regulator